jgi:hypothetical protein
LAIKKVVRDIGRVKSSPLSRKKGRSESSKEWTLSAESWMNATIGYEVEKEGEERNMQQGRTGEKKEMNQPSTTGAAFSRATRLHGAGPSRRLERGKIEPLGSTQA